MLNEELKIRLLAMAERDTRVRAELAESGELFGGHNERMADVHKQNAESLEKVIDEFGWPGRSLVGSEGAEAAWLILQHAIGLPAFQRKCLQILKEAVNSGEASEVQLAYLEDRISVFEERPQRYGTQFDWDGNGRLVPQPIEDPEKVNEYRSAIGLRPLAEELQEIRRRAAGEGHQQPDDFDEYVKAQKAWARSVGWL